GQYLLGFRVRPVGHHRRAALQPDPAGMHRGGQAPGFHQFPGLGQLGVEPLHERSQGSEVRWGPARLPSAGLARQGVIILPRPVNQDHVLHEYILSTGAPVWRLPAETSAPSPRSRHPCRVSLQSRPRRSSPTGSVPVWYEALMWIAMSTAEREGFLADVHVGVLCTAFGTTGQTLAVPVWYSYQPGGLLTVLTGRRSRKAAAIRAAGRFGLCVHDDSPPYRYVSVEGPVVGEEELDPAERLAMARRYLRTAGGDRYIADNPDPGGKNVAFRMRPEHWLSQDQGKRPAPST